MVNEFDKENMEAVLDDFPNQVKKGIEICGELAIEGEIDKIVLCGMGGSSIIGEILKGYLKHDLDMPIIISRTYSLPKFVDKKTLIISSSYSGNTEETVATYREAIRKNLTVVAISSGGKIEELSKINKNPFIKVPGGLQPRFSIGYTFFALLKLFENSGFIESKKEDTKKTDKALRKPIIKDMAKKLVEKIKDKIPIIYVSDDMYAVGYKWKSGISENGKTHAFFNVIPEMNHVELIGYTLLKGDYHVIMLKDDEDLDKIKKRFTISKELIKEKGVEVTEIEIKGDCFLTKMFSAIHIGDWVSFYLAMEEGVDPSPIPMIEDLKKRLK